MTAALAQSLPSAADPRPVWTYDEDYTGQEEWGSLSPEYAACGNGTAQSPISISFTETTERPAPDFHYAAGKAQISFYDHAIHAAIHGDSHITAEGKKYRLKDIEFHSPSEHTVGDLFYPVEIQLKHENEQGGILIVAVFVDIGADNAFIQSVLDRLSIKPGDSMEATLDPSQLLPETRGYYAYSGSLTTPPCTEGVSWVLFKKSLLMSRKQLARLTAHIGRNARVPQPVYMRTVNESH